LHPQVSALSFRLGKIPVRITPSFLVMAVVLGLYGLAGAGGPERVVAWIAIVFVSVLLHELGHATVGLAFGLEPRIDLHGMGGTTSWSGGRPLSRARRILISLAGPGAGFVLAAIVYFGLPGVFPPTPLGGFVYDNVLSVNFFWGVANLVPMLPLDGGNVMTQLLDALTGGRGERPARYVSIVVAALAAPAAFFLWNGNWWAALLALSFIGANVQGLRDLDAREHDAPKRVALQQAYDALHARDGERVVALARPVALSARTAPLRAEALQLLAWGFLLEGRVADADAAVAALPQGFTVDPGLVELRSRYAR
jgi:Zn-dependent protease